MRVHGVASVALSPGIVRFRYAPNSTFGPDESFAVLKDSGFSTPEVKVTDKGPKSWLKRASSASW